MPLKGDTTTFHTLVKFHVFCLGELRRYRRNNSENASADLVVCRMKYDAYSVQVIRDHQCCHRQADIRNPTTHTCTTRHACSCKLDKQD